LRTLAGHADWVFGVAVTSDGRAVSASRDNTLKVWDLETGAEVAKSACDAGVKRCACADGRIMVAGNDAGRCTFSGSNLIREGEIPCSRKGYTAPACELVFHVLPFA
jgi:WD40 repeat protein